MNKKAMSFTEGILTYGWVILIVVIAVSALAYFGLMKPNNEPPTLPSPVNTYDCGNIFVRGTETITGELQNASFAPKRATDSPVNESVFMGRFLKAYYDMNNCVTVLESSVLSPEKIVLLPNGTG